MDDSIDLVALEDRAQSIQIRDIRLNERDTVAVSDHRRHEGGRITSDRLGTLIEQSLGDVSAYQPRGARNQHLHDILQSERRSHSLT